MKYGRDGLLHFMQNFKDLHAGSESRIYIDFKHKANEQRKPTITSESYHYINKKLMDRVTKLISIFIYIYRMQHYQKLLLGKLRTCKLGVSHSYDTK